MKKDIVIFGDSIAYGIGDPILGGWVDLLKRYVWEHQPNLNVYNFCIDGNSTRDLLQRVNIQTAQTLYEKEAIFLAIGINDSVFYADGRNFMVDIEFRDNLRKLLRQSKAFASARHIYLVGLVPVDESRVCPFPESRTGKSWNNSRIKKFDQLIESIAQEEEVIYIPLFDLIDSQKDMYDGLHVNTAGQKKMFDAIIKKVHFLIK